MNNVPTYIANKIGKHLYRNLDNPIYLAKEKVLDYFPDLARIEIDNPYVPVEYNFDRLRFPNNHFSRKPENTFYKDKFNVLRTHMTCYLYPLGHTSFSNSKLRYIICGDVYRKEVIDPFHYSIFHQIDTFYIVDDGVDVKQDLRKKIKGLIEHLFGKKCKFKIIEDSDNKDIYFPFTIDSFEVEIEYKDLLGKKHNIEILGAGTIHPDIMKDLGLPHKQAWAFGLGLDRLAMIMFDIPDIRLLWSTNQKFVNQFIKNKKYTPFITTIPIYKHLSIPLNKNFSFTNFCSIIKNEDHEDMIESIFFLEDFKKKNISYKKYEIVYKGIDKQLNISEINRIHNNIKRQFTL